ncbi:c-type cytochrome [Ramlibacter ginsenosidimutans]|uniref:c-type cytochrome n=1 Tax=Ramlibacter ginsenosidimutans TaxID=502333 RepID=UPI00191EA8DD|nr:c-type cytochrome [Ramlibacter ginsenosidimutans]
MKTLAAWCAAALLCATAPASHADGWLPLPKVPQALGRPAWNVPGGDPQRGQALISRMGCAGCHTIPGIAGADGNVGPPLTRIGDRIFIAGVLRNTPENMVHWVQHPQSVVPGNAMPEMGITEAQARDIASYLYTLR